MGLNLERDELQALRERETILQPGKVMTFLFVLKEAGSVWTFISYWCAEGSSDSSWRVLTRQTKQMLGTGGDGKCCKSQLA